MSSDYVVKSIVETVVSSLDDKPVDASYVVVKQLNSDLVKILINSKPLSNKQQLAEYWAKLPLTQHRVQSYDYHSVPGINLINIIVSGKVRFDESGRNRMNELADLIPQTNNSSNVARPIWGSWFGFTINLVVDSSKVNNNSLQQECVNSFDYRINYIPADSVISV